MFNDSDLISHLQTNNTIKVDSLVIAEWNQNDLTNIENYGNYRWRPSSASVDVYRNLNPSYDQNDIGNFYTDALESEHISKYKTDNPNEPLIFITKEEERQLYYSLRECLKPFRPRSGINKMLYFSGKNIDGTRSGMRPRYYFSSRHDKFKYWSSYRKENGSEYGISSTVAKNFNTDLGYEITDSVPFVVYKNEVIANRIVVKMQTNLAANEVIGIDGTPVVPSQIRQENATILDPLSDRSKSTIPLKWKIQYLDGLNNWNDAAIFDETSRRSDGSSIVDWDGYVELSYGVKIPDEYRTDFHFIDTISSSAQLPNGLINGEAYIITENGNSDPGLLYIWNSRKISWDIKPVEYGFSLVENDDTKRIGLVKDLTNPEFYFDGETKVYKDIAFIRGIRVVVERMTAPDKTFDLIEMSARLKADISNYVVDFEITKDIAATDYGLPVGALVASTGTLTLSNSDGAFTRLNTFNKDTQTGSIVANNLKPQIKFDFYESVLNVNGYDKFIPLKTLYSENSSESYSGSSDVSLNLRDSFFRLESEKVDPIFLQNCTLTMAIATMLDNIGFSNYVFKNITTANDPVIPFFFVEPDATVADILQRLAQSTQTAMFFDEYNNFCVMPKEYLLPEYSINDSDSSISDRLIVLYGQKTNNNVPNIQSISGVEAKIINDGQINYTTRYIEREVSRLEQAQLDLSKRTYGYKSSVLWEIGESEELRTINQPVGKGTYALGAVSLNYDLNDQPPSVDSTGNLVNNIIDVGESAIWMPRFQGYLYANGEIIRYDAQEYDVSGTGLVWVSSNSEYQKYFSKLPFNGQMILTGRIRIYAEPFYQNLPGANQSGLEQGVSLKPGVVKSHGRAQFGTTISYHSSGLASYWTDRSNLKSFRSNSSYLFKTVKTEDISYPPLTSDTAGERSDSAAQQQASVSGKIANFMKQSVITENNSSSSNQDQVGSIQASALVLTGAKTASTPRDLITFVNKTLDRDYKHVGTRMRIIGKQIDDKTSIPVNSTTYFTVNANNQTSYLAGGSGGIGFMIDQSNKSGYYFEIMSLSKDTLENFSNSSTTEVLDNIIFYKITDKKVRYPHYDENGSLVSSGDDCVPIKLWGTSSKILTDSGKFVGMDRLAAEEKPTVYDLAIEYEVIGSSAKFYLYLNNILIATVIDNSPLPSVTTNTAFNTCLFVRGASKCMFENIYALKNRSTQSETITAVTNTNNSSRSIISNIANNKISISDALRKYAMSGIIQSTYLSSIGAEKPPRYSIYFDEFGTIMRECAYFNIKYDQAYPAIVAKFVPPFNNEKTYTISGFIPGSYGAEFLILNSTDKAIALGSDSANRVMISGVTFTQNISNVLKVDDYFGERANMSDPVIIDNVIKSPEKAQKFYDDIKTSRSIYGNKSFSLDSLYIQNEDSAKNLMSWIISKTMKKRKIISVNTFATPHIQLGDIVKINYQLPEGVRFVEEDTRFVVTSIKYSRSSDNIGIILTLVEV